MKKRENAESPKFAISWRLLLPIRLSGKVRQADRNAGIGPTSAFPHLESEIRHPAWKNQRTEPK